MWSLLRPGVTLFILLTVITGLLYPAVTTGLGRLLFPDQAAGATPNTHILVDLVTSSGSGLDRV